MLRGFDRGGSVGRGRIGLPLVVVLVLAAVPVRAGPGALDRLRRWLTGEGGATGPPAPVAVSSASQDREVPQVILGRPSGRRSDRAGNGGGFLILEPGAPDRRGTPGWVVRSRTATPEGPAPGPGPLRTSTCTTTPSGRQGAGCGVPVPVMARSGNVPFTATSPGCPDHGGSARDLRGLAPSGRIEIPISRSDYAADSVAWDGTSFWVVARHRYQPHEQNYRTVSTMTPRSPLLLRLARDGTELGRYPTGRGGNPQGGLTSDGRFLYDLNTVNITRWAGNRETRSGLGTVDRFDLSGGFVDSFPASGGPRNTYGIAWTGDGFYQAQSDTSAPLNWIYRLDARGRELESQRVPYYIGGLAWDGHSLWTSAPATQEVHQLDSGLSIRRSVRLATRVADIAFAPDGLWAASTLDHALLRFEVDR